jgi:hypothetical protein
MVIGARYPWGVVETGRVEVEQGASAFALGQINGLDEERFWRFVYSQLGKPYDWRGALGIGANRRNWRQEDRWFCFELVAAASEYGGVPLVRKEASWVTGDDIETSLAVTMGQVWRKAA